jgi:hypothetical protein
MRRTSLPILLLVVISACKSGPRKPKLSYDPLSCASCLKNDIEDTLHVGDDEAKVRDFCTSRGLFYWRKDGQAGCEWSESHPLTSSRGDLTVKIQFDQDNRYRGFEILPAREKWP